MRVSADQRLEEYMESMVVKRNNPEMIALWTERITECKSSGKHTPEWCSEHGINVKTYYYWHNKIHKMVKQQNTFYEVPQKPAGYSDKPAATIRIAGIQADIYSGADAETIHALCTALRRC